jgi:hypothetical protein
MRLQWEGSLMKRAINKSFKSTPANVVAKVQAELNSVSHKTFDELRAAIPELTGKKDGEVEQAVIDSSFDVDV